MIRAVVINRRSLQITGYDPALPPALLRQWLGDVAELADQRIARDYEAERAAGAALRANTEATDQRKAADGLDTRKGHATGNLQDHLDQGGYWDIGAVNARSATINWDEDALQADVDYAQYVAQAKVKGGQLLVLLAKDARVAAQYITQRQAEWQQAGSGRRATGTASRGVASRGFVARAKGLGTSGRVA